MEKVQEVVGQVDAFMAQYPTITQYGMLHDGVSLQFCLG